MSGGHQAGDFELKRLSRDAVPAALDKAERYRLLNEAAEAESICHDVLAADPDNQRALVILLLALTDRFGKGYGVDATRAQDVLPRLKNPYERAYYAGVICERRGKAQLQQGTPGLAPADWFRDAMRHYEVAESLRPPGNDDAILRWNTCARIITENHLRESSPDDSPEMGLE
jgi:hypothetical protein